MDNPIHAFYRRLNELADDLSALDLSSEFVSCLTCKSFSEATELCGKCGQRPPARVLVHGCEAWVDGDAEPPVKSQPVKVLPLDPFTVDGMDDDIPF